jgi:hypothetical protein
MKPLNAGKTEYFLTNLNKVQQLELVSAKFWNNELEKAMQCNSDIKVSTR